MLVNDESQDVMNSIDGKKFKKMLFSALDSLKEQQSLIDSLNVFPVPDGDTGTNMYLTFLEAIKEVKQTDSNRVDEINSALARGALMGARGNSGVILSQLIRGFSQANEGNKELGPERMVESFEKASEIAYQGVLKPVEGTILTVSRKAAEGAEMAYENNLDIVGIMENTVETARQALEKTPEQLPALKEAGVVDAGGQGYLTILEGMLAGLTSKKVSTTTNFDSLRSIETGEGKEIEVETEEEINFTYCTQALIKVEDNFDSSIDKIRNDLQNYGDSLMVVGSDNVIKIHIHTDHPGIILEYGLKMGSLDNIKIDNMIKQNKEKRKREEEKQKRDFAEVEDEEKISVNKNKGIIAVGKGEGIKRILSELGVDLVIDGGQSMNPSTNDFVKSINKIESQDILILPNNKNIISAAQQAASLSDKNVMIINTKSIPEAISSLITYNDESELDELKEKMEKEIEKVKTLEITTAIKDSKIKGMEIEEGDIIGLVNGNINARGEHYEEVVMELFSRVLAEEEELVTIYYGEEISDHEVNELREKIKDRFGLEEVEMYYGGQPLYPYIISIE